MAHILHGKGDMYSIKLQFDFQITFSVIAQRNLDWIHNPVCYSVISSLSY